MRMEEDEDYYNLLEEDEGCCLKCSHSEEGCLCYDCKCTKCYWYISPEDWDGEKGKCGYVVKMKKKSPFSRDLIIRYFDIEEITIKPEMWLKKTKNEKLPMPDM